MRLSILLTILLFLGACQTLKKTVSTGNCNEIAASFNREQIRLATLPATTSKADIDKITNGVVQMLNVKCDMEAYGIINVKLIGSSLKGYEVVSEKYPSPITISL